MLPRFRTTASTQCLSIRRPTQTCNLATAAAIVPAVQIEDMHRQIIPIERHPPMAPPSYKPPELRKSQLHRQYTSLLRSTPLMLLFQHNNLKAAEWAAIRRELAAALRKTSQDTVLPGMPDPADSVRITTIQTGIFAAALRVVEFYKPAVDTTVLEKDQAISAASQTYLESKTGSALSREAYLATLHPKNPKLKNPDKKFRFDPRPSAHRKRNTPLHKMLHGPIAVLSFPDVTAQHLAAALSILAPTPGASSAFPAPRRKANPSYYEDSVQFGLQKLLLLGAKVEGRTMDGEGVRWVGGLAKSGGVDALRAQLVHLLQSVGGGITNALEGAGRSLWVTMEGRRLQLEEDGKPKEKKKEEEAEVTSSSS